jgi:hypothetical protein
MPIVAQLSGSNEMPVQGPPMDRDRAIRNLIAEIIRSSPQSRDVLADEMSRITGQRITRRMLDDFSALSKRAHRFPLSFVVAFCEITGDDRLQRMALSPRLRKLLELGERKLAAELSIRNTLQQLVKEKRCV